MTHTGEALRGQSGYATLHEAVVTPFPAPACPGPDSEAWIDVDAPARARRRAEALDRIRKRENAILRAVGQVSPVPAVEVWNEISIEPEPPAPKLALVPSPEAQLKRAAALEAVKAAAPVVRLSLITAVLACSMLAWATAWMLVRFLQ